MSVSVVYVRDLGHVVAALAVTGADPPAEVASLVGGGLPLRITLGGGAVATLPLAAGRLAATVVDDDPGVFDGPLAFAVEAADGRPGPTLTPLAPWDDPLQLTRDLLTITLPVPVTRLTPVLALISGGGETHVLAGQIPAGGRTAMLQVSLGAGDHAVLVLVAGQAGRFETVPVA